jgi:hypothetical protein
MREDGGLCGLAASEAGFPPSCRELAAERARVQPPWDSLRRRANPTEGAHVSLARVVTFTGVTSDRIEEIKREMDEGEQPEGLNPSEMFVLHDPDSSEAIAILVFDSDEDYQRGHEVLDAMPTPETPGQRTSVKRYDVAIRRSR